MNIKIWCEECKGTKTITTAITVGRGIIACDTKPCQECGGKGYTEHKGSLDDLECAEIERELLEKAFRLDVYTLNSLETELQITLWFENNDKSFIGKTKLEAYRKAKNWMDGRGAE